MARGTSYEEVPGPRGGVVRFKIVPLPTGGYARRQTRAQPQPGDRILAVRPGAAPAAYKVGPRGGRQPIATTSRMRGAAGDVWKALAATSPGKRRHRHALEQERRALGLGPLELDEQGFVTGGPRGSLDRFPRQGKPAKKGGRAPTMAERLGVTDDEIRRGGPARTLASNAEAAAVRRVVGRGWLELEGVFANAPDRTLYQAARGQADGLYQGVLDRKGLFLVELEVRVRTETGRERGGMGWTFKDSWPGLPPALVSALVAAVVLDEAGWEISAGGRPEDEVDEDKRVDWLRADLTVWEVAA